MNTERAYLIRRGATSWTSIIPSLGCVALDADASVAAALRAGLVRQKRAGEAGQWRIDDSLETIYPSEIFTVRINSWTSGLLLRTFYAARSGFLGGYVAVWDEEWMTFWDRIWLGLTGRKRTAFWGRVGTRVTREERQARAERDQYRKNHRDGVDPLKEVVSSLLRDLPSRPADPPVVYLAAARGRIRRGIGVFTTLQRAYAATPANAVIVEVPADGETPLRKARMIRGDFESGWGYASGYAPEHLNNSSRRQYEPHASTS